MQQETRFLILMKSALLIGPGRIEIREGGLPVAGPGDVVVKNLVCGVCRTDRKCYNTGQVDLVLPRVLGHEIIGVVQNRVGGIPHKPGDIVVVHPGVSCGKCEWCLSGRDNMCDDVGIMGFGVDGGFAEYTLVPARGVEGGALLPVPDGMSARVAALSEPLACAIRQKRLMGVGSTGRLLVVGAGALGVLTAKLWSLEGWGVRLVDTNSAKVDIAACLGFEASTVAEGEFDAAVVCAPGAGAYKTAVRHLGKWGTLGFFSGVTGDEGIDRSTLNQVHYRELRVVGAYGCALEDTRAALALLDGTLAIEERLITSIGLDELEANLGTETENIFTQLNFMEVR
jgi:L-iditol 2-dehydrogenase